MPFPKSQVCMLIEVSGGDFSRHGDFPSLVQFIVQFSDDPIRSAPGYIQDFGDFCCRQEFPLRIIASRFVIRHSNLLSGGTCWMRYPHDINIILFSPEDPQTIPPDLFL